MEPDDLKTAWQSLETRMARSDAIQLALLRDTRLVRAKAQLRPLKIGQWLQAALGLGLILLGGVLYTLGAGVFATKWPNPSPKWFGFHEVFHSFTLGGWASHFVAATLVVTAVR